MDVKRSSSRCFRGDNLHPREKVLCTLPAISLIPPISFEIKEDNMHSIIMQFKNIDHCAHLRENEPSLCKIYFIAYARENANHAVTVPS